MFAVIVMSVFLIFLGILEIKDYEKKRMKKRKQEIKDRNFKAVIRGIKATDKANREFGKKYNIKVG